MSRNNHKRNVDGLRSHAAAKKDAAAKRIDFAIRTLTSKTAAVNFNAVATLAHVSKTTLYGNPDYRDRIEHLRRNQALSPIAAAKRNITDKGKDIIVAAKSKRIIELEAEVSRLSNILKRCYANEYDKY